MHYFSPKMKRVTDPLDEKAKARIIGHDSSRTDYGSSGSEHSCQADDDVTSSSLSEPFFSFDDHKAVESPASDADESDCDRDPSMYDSYHRNVDLINPILMDQADEFRNVIRAHVLKALYVLSKSSSSDDKQMLRRNVVAFLRDSGFNAAICKTKWQSCGGLTGGRYEFIDVVSKDSDDRYFVDLDFASEFEIARPTVSYERLQQCLPKVFVGNAADLKQILKAMSDGARMSLKSGGLILPPWRKHRFMQNKWLGSYRRTTNVFPTPSNQSYAVTRCAVGFDAGVNGVGLMCRSTARTK